MADKDINKTLIDMKAKIDTATAEANRLKGRLEQVMSALKAFGCSSVEEARVKLREMGEQIDKSEAEFGTALERLHTEYNL